MEIIKLNNGITLILDYLNTTKSASISILVKAGSDFEKYAKHGISHFLEHMMFKGTKKRTAMDISYDLESIGAIVNAYTSKECTVYYTTSLSQYLPKCIDILHDIFTNSIFDEEEIKKECNVILQEIAQYDDDEGSVAEDKLLEVMYGNHISGRNIIGTKESVSSITRDDLIRYFKTMYRPKDTVISIAGNFNKTEIKSLVIDLFGEIKDFNDINDFTVNDRLAYDFQSPVYIGGDTRSKKDVQQVHLLLGLKASSIRDKNYSQKILSTIMGRGMSSRLFQNIREQKGLVYHISSSISNFANYGAFNVYAISTPENFKQLIQSIGEEFKNVLKDGISENELNKAKALIKMGIVTSQESSINRSTHLASSYSIFRDDIMEVDKILEEIDAVQKDDVIKEANILIDISNLKNISVSLVGKVDEIKDNYSDIKSMII